MRTLVDSLFQDIRYAFRGFRRTPLFAAGVAGTIGLGLGFLCSAFTVVNGYLLKPVLLPDPYALYELSWDTPAERRHRLTIDDLDSLREGNEVFSNVLGVAGVQIVSQVLASVIEILPAFGVGPYIIGALVVLAAAAVAASVPSVRAARVDPATALRTE